VPEGLEAQDDSEDPDDSDNHQEPDDPACAILKQLGCDIDDEDGEVYAASEPAKTWAGLTQHRSGTNERDAEHTRHARDMARAIKTIKSDAKRGRRMNEERAAEIRRNLGLSPYIQDSAVSTVTMAAEDPDEIRRNLSAAKSWSGPYT
jgi:hypothetical protein